MMFTLTAAEFVDPGSNAAGGTAICGTPSRPTTGESVSSTGDNLPAEATTVAALAALLVLSIGRWLGCGGRSGGGSSGSGRARTAIVDAVFEDFSLRCGLGGSHSLVVGPDEGVQG